MRACGRWTSGRGTGGRPALRLAATAAAAAAVLALAGGAGASHPLLSLDSVGPAGGNGPFNAFYRGVSADGARLWLETDEALVPGDTDGFVDVYERAGGVTRLVSTGPDGGNGPFDAYFAGASADGGRVFVETDEPLAAADGDASFDVYERSAGSTSLVSPGVEDVDAAFRAVSADGTAVFLETAEALAPEDADEAVDVYRLRDGAPELVSGPDAAPASYRASSADGARVLLETAGALVPEDGDGAVDVYAAEGGALTLLSGGATGVRASFRAASADARRVLFETAERLVAADVDAAVDVYAAGGGGIALVTPGEAEAPVTFRAASADAARVVFETAEALVPGDADGLVDAYAAGSDGSATLLSAGAVEGAEPRPVRVAGASRDASRVLLETAEALLPEDGDAAVDVYERAGGVTRLLSEGGAGTLPVRVAGASADGLSVFLATAERLVEADGDGSLDVYERAGGVTTLLSTGPAGGNGPFAAVVAGVSDDGSRVAFTTFERLVEGDEDAREDVYSASFPDGPSEGEPPVVVVEPAAGEARAPSGWFAAATGAGDGVTVEVRATDPDGVSRVVCTAGAAVVLDVAGASGSFTLGDGRHAVACEATDSAARPSTGAGPGSTPMPVALDVDGTAPTVACEAPAPGPAFLLRGPGGPVAAAVADDGSGPASPTASAPADASTAGNRTARVEGSDVAGNAGSAECPYRVAYALSLDRGPRASVKAGAPIQVRFALADAAGLPIADAEAGAIAAACGATLSLPPAAPACAAYDARKDELRVDLKTDRATPPGTRPASLVVSAPDGSGPVVEEAIPLVVR